MPYIGKTPLTGAYQLCDTITTSATATYNLLVGGSAVIPGAAQNCIVSLNGVVQAPVSAYTVSGSTIVFSSTLSATDVIDFILILGNVFDIGKPTDGSVTNASVSASAAIALSKLATTGTMTFASTIGVGGATPAASGAGITFPASASASSDANTLDDYEEGTWDFAVTTTTGSVTMNSNDNACWYTKIGRVVYTGGQVSVSSVSSPTGAIIITLPFTGADLSESAEYNSGSISVSGSVSKNVRDFVLFKSNPTEMRIFIADGSTVSSANANAQQLTTSTQINFQLTYIAT
jgi:hypothetical protein